MEVMSNPWAKSFEELRSPYLQEKKAKKDYDGDGKVETGSKEHAGVVHNAIQKSKGGKPDGKDTRKEETVTEKKGLWDNIHAKRKRGEAPAKKGDKDYPKTLNVEAKYDNTKSPDYAKKKKALAKKHGGNIKGHPQYEHHGIDIEHIDGSVTEITDVIKAPKMVAAPKLSNWREDFVWDEPVDEALKRPKLDIQEKGVKNKVEINPSVATEGAMSKDKEGHTTGGFRISDREAKKAKERLKKKYKKEEVEQIDEIDNLGGKVAATLTTGAVMGGLKLMGAAKNAAERLKNKKSDAMKKALGEGSLKQARKNVGAKTCWDGYKAKGTKMKGGKAVPNCVKEEEKKNFDEAQVKYYSGQDRNPNTGLPKGLKPAVRTEKEVNKKLDRTTLAQSYEPEGEVLSDGYQRNPERDTRSARQRRMDDPDRGINSQAFRDFMAAQQSKPKKKKKKVEEGAYETVKKVLDTGSNFMKKNPVGKALSNVVKPFKSTDGGSNRTSATAASQKAKNLRVSEEVVSELNRYEKETGKSSGSMNMPKGKPTSKGGTSSPVMRAVRTKIRKETGKPTGQTSKKKGEKGNRQPGDRKTTPADSIAKRRESRADAEKLMRDTRGT